MLRKVLSKVEEGRFARALVGLQSGWQFEVSRRVFVQRGVEVSGYVKYTGKKYGVTVQPTGCFCSCEDALVRKVMCKHIAFVAMSELAHYAAERSAHRQPEEVRPTS